MGNSIDLKKWREENLVHKLIYDWIFVPLGIIAILCVVILVNQIFKAIGFNFPANVTGMLIVAIVLISMEYILKEERMNKILKWINPAIDFLMNWMIVFFLPPLVTVLNSTVLPSGKDIVKLIIVFFIGLVIFIPWVGYVIHYASVLFGKIIKSTKSKSSVEMKEVKEKKENENTVEVIINDDDDEEEKTMDITSYDDGSHSSEDTITHTPKQKNEVIDVVVKEEEDTTSNHTIKESKPPTTETKKRHFQWKSSAVPSKYCFITYIIIYAVSWIPAALWNITQPLHIAVNVLSYFIGLCIPDKIRLIFHPLVSCTLFSYIFFWIQGLIFGRSLKEELNLYSNNSKYLLYINDTSLPFPKAGEILFCILDATVVALAFRIFEHHKLIIKHIFELVGSIILMSFVSMLVHTLLCRLFGIAPVYSLSMTSRSATTPLAVQVVNYLHSDMVIAIVIVVFTGVFTDIMGLPLLKLVRFPLNDSLAHGVCMGCTGHAVATAGLIKEYPSASAVSSISFVLFSTFCVIWSAIPPVANLFRSIAGL